MNAFMAAGPMVSSYYQPYDAPVSPSGLSSAGVTARRAPTRLPPPPPPPKPKPKELFVPVVDPDLYMHRHNSSAEALGTFRLLRVLCLRFYFSTDFFIGAIPMGITAVLIVANMALVWHQVGWREYIFTLFMLATTFGSYLLTTSTDPGIYPRLRSGEKDPLEGNMQLVFCKECRLRRPPRCSHCYHCKVCVLEHDHHCSILGGCVGVRNLRWFTLYLLSCCSSTMIGVVWLIRYLFNDLFTPDEPAHNETGALPVSTPHPTMLGGRRSFEGSENSASHLAAIFVLLLDGIVVMLVGAMLCIYVYLTLTSTTRRESARKQNSLEALLRPRTVWHNFKKVLSPPPSMLRCAHHIDDDETIGLI
ncbi:palmitoyl acyltransferase 9 [Novymonas esmeraldas]|uniref:Palmitoyltransferase n=1 Tax=Novymonas esmeraldas TaxID=1808958 RepID=A0AAW0EUQ9_9TRYP